MIKELKMNLPKNLKFYLKYGGLGLISVSFLFSSSPIFRYIFGAGLLLFGLSFVKRKRKGRILEHGRREKKERPKYKGHCEYCNKEIPDVLDRFYCKYCQEHHCTKHRLPEDHDCLNPTNPHVSRN